MTKERADKVGAHRTQATINKKKILATQSVCAICGKPVDKSLKYPDPWSATVDHIIPINKGGHPSDIDNMQLAHFRCNRLKSDKLVPSQAPVERKVVGNTDLPLSADWAEF